MTENTGQIYLETAAIADQLRFLHLEKSMPGELPLLRRLKNTSEELYTNRLLQDIEHLIDLGEMPKTRIVWDKATEIQKMSASEQEKALLAYAQSLGPRE